jgi:hypothetical protein
MRDPTQLVFPLRFSSFFPNFRAKPQLKYTIQIHTKTELTEFVCKFCMILYDVGPQNAVATSYCDPLNDIVGTLPRSEQCELPYDDMLFDARSPNVGTCPDVSDRPLTGQDSSECCS